MINSWSRINVAANATFSAFLCSILLIAVWATASAACSNSLFLSSTPSVHTITAIATDSNGAQTTSAPVSVTVASGSGQTISCGQSVTGSLSLGTSSGSTDQPGCLADLYTFSGTAGQTVTIVMSSGVVSPYLTLFGPGNTIIAQNGNAAQSGVNADITTALTATGTYTIEATTAIAGQTGPYTLSLNCAQSTTAPALSVAINGTTVASGSTFSFGSTPQTVPVTAIVTLTNTGTADLSITGFTGSGDFSQIGAIGSPVPAGGSTSFNLRFNATNIGTTSGSIVLSNTGPTNPYTVNLTGSVPTTSTIAVTALTLSPTTVSGGQPTTATVTISGAAPSGGQAVKMSVAAGAPVAPPATVIIPQGQTSATFTIPTSATAGSSNVQVYALLGPLSAPTSYVYAVLSVTATGTPPSVSIGSPAAGTTLPLSAASTVSASASATTTGASISSVVFSAQSSVAGSPNVEIGTATSSPFSISWTPAAIGTYVLTAVATDSNALTATSSPVSVTVAAGSRELTPSITPTSGTLMDGSGVAISDRDTAAQIFYTTDGSAPSPSNGTLYSAPFYLTPSATAYTVQAIAYGQGLLASTVASATLSSIFATSVGSPPTVAITSPADGTAILTPTAITGTIGIASGSNLVSNWVMDYQTDNTTGAAPSTWTVFGQGSGNAPSATLDTTLMMDGLYTVRLTAYNTAGVSGVDTITVLVEGAQKVGYFTMSFNDMTVPIAGLPISIGRTYDSRNKQAGDFGAGWTLSSSGAQVTESDTMGDDWTQLSVGGGFEVVPTKAHIVTVTLPNNTTYSFSESLNPNESSYYPVQYGTIIFTPLPGTHGTLTTTVPADALVEQSSGPQQLVDADDDDEPVLDRSEYILTLPDGRKIDVDAVNGLQSITDRDGNLTRFTSSGITTTTASGAAKGVTITRSANGLISQITDPNGQSVTYTAGADGNLDSTTDRDGNTTTFTYDAIHDLTGIVDPRGVQRSANRNFIILWPYPVRLFRPVRAVMKL